MQEENKPRSSQELMAPRSAVSRPGSYLLATCGHVIESDTLGVGLRGRYVAPRTGGWSAGLAFLTLEPSMKWGEPWKGWTGPR